MEQLKQLFEKFNSDFSNNVDEQAQREIDAQYFIKDLDNES